MSGLSEKATITRAAILREFNDQIYRNGYKNTTLKGICDALEISTGHLYYYFKKKEDLYINLFRDFVGKITIIFDSHFDAGVDALMKTLLIDRFARFMNLNIPELKVIRTEIVDSMNIITETASMFTDIYADGLKHTGHTHDRQTVLIGQQFAVSGEYALQKLAFEKKFAEMTDDQYSDLGITVFFKTIDFPMEKADAYRTASQRIFSALNKNMLVGKVYDMSEYTYATNAVEPDS